MGTHRNATVSQRVMICAGDLDYLTKRLEQLAAGNVPTREMLLSESRELHGLAEFLHSLSVETEQGGTTP